jgi:hypothetical protein
LFYDAATSWERAEFDLRFIIAKLKNLVWRRWLLAMLLVFHVGFSVPHARDVLFCATDENSEEISIHHSPEGFDVSLSSSDEAQSDIDCLDKVFCAEFEGVSRSSLVRLTINNVIQQKSKDVLNLLQPIWVSDLRGLAPPAVAQYFFLQSKYIFSLSSPTVVFLPTIILAV